MSAQLREFHSNMVKAHQANSPKLPEMLNKCETAYLDADLSDLGQEQIEIIMRDIYEITALVQLQQLNIDAFKSTLDGVMKFYDTASTESPMKWQMTGLHLLSLLAADNLIQFHMALERIPKEVRKNNPFIKMPVQMEQNLNVGFYNRIENARGNLPSPTYSYFFEQLVDIVRARVAGSMAKAYSSLPVEDASKRLLFNGPDAEKKTLEFGRREGWLVEKQKFIFTTTADDTLPGHQPDELFDANRLSGYYLKYATQLDKIV